MKKVFLAVILMALMFTNSLAQESKEITLQIEKGEKWHHNLQILFFQKKNCRRKLQYGVKMRRETI